MIESEFLAETILTLANQCADNVTEENSAEQIRKWHSVNYIEYGKEEGIPAWCASFVCALALKAYCQLLAVPFNSENIVKVLLAHRKEFQEEFWTLSPLSLIHI